MRIYQQIEVRSSRGISFADLNSFVWVWHAKKMVGKIETYSKLEVRAVIRFLQAIGTSQSDIHRRLVTVYDEGVLSRKEVWSHQTKEAKMIKCWSDTSAWWCPTSHINQTKAWLEKSKWEVIQHPTYSPDLAPSDFHLFGLFKNFLSGKRFDDQNALQNPVLQYFTSLGWEVYHEGNFKLVKRWDKCLSADGGYVEK